MDQGDLVATGPTLAQQDPPGAADDVVAYLAGPQDPRHSPTHIHDATHVPSRYLGDPRRFRGVRRALPKNPPRAPSTTTAMHKVEGDMFVGRSIGAGAPEIALDPGPK